jgi:hypothetical protein
VKSALDTRLLAIFGALSPIANFQYPKCVRGDRVRIRGETSLRVCERRNVDLGSALLLFAPRSLLRDRVAESKKKIGRRMLGVLGQSLASPSGKLPDLSDGRLTSSTRVECSAAKKYWAQSEFL